MYTLFPLQWGDRPLKRKENVGDSKKMKTEEEEEEELQSATVSTNFGC